jgi:hypothetical protein
MPNGGYCGSEGRGFESSQPHKANSLYYKELRKAKISKRPVPEGKMQFSKEEKAMWLEDWRQSGKSAWAYAAD